MDLGTRSASLGQVRDVDCEKERLHCLCPL
jgi:hypothetical protein